MPLRVPASMCIFDANLTAILLFTNTSAGARKRILYLAIEVRIQSRLEDARSERIQQVLWIGYATKTHDIYTKHIPILVI